MPVSLANTSANATAIKTDGSAVTQPVSGTVAVSTINSVAPAFGSGVRGATVQRVTIATDDTVKTDGSATTQPVSGTIAVSTINSVAPAFNTGVRGATVQRVTIATDDVVQTQSVPVATGGLSTFHLVSAATTNATNIKASAGQVYGWYIYNSNAAARKVAFHNTAGTPTAGASIFFSLMIPAGGAANVEFSNGIPFSTGIGISTVTGLADNDSVAVAANDLIINIFYK
jgi:hypothetical protein